MNFSIFKKVLNLPLSTTETAIGLVLAYHVQKDGNSCFPSYKTISIESGAVNKTISRVIRTLSYAGVLEFKHRANILTGKESNEYFFIFDDIKFYRDKLSSKAEKAIFVTKIKEARIKAKADMEENSAKLKEKNTRAIPSHSNVTDTVTNALIQKSQNVKNDVCNAAGLEGHSIPSHFPPIPSQMLRRSNRDDVQPAINNTNDLNKQPCNEKKQKTVLQDEDSYYDVEHASDNPFLAGKDKKASEQTDDEWWADYDNA